MDLPSDEILLRDPLKEWAERVRRAREARIEAHALVRESKDYQDAWKYIRRITLDFLNGLRVCRLMSTRAPKIYEEMLVFRLLDDLIQSALSTWPLIENGFLNQVKREMRYMVESSVKNLYVDQQLPNAMLQDRVTFLHDKVDRSSISMAGQIQLGGFDANKAKEFTDELADLYYKACAYIHPSKRQIEEQLALAEDGRAYGFETADELREVGRLLFRLYDMVLVLIFSGLGIGLAGDVFVNVLDERTDWRYHKGKYVKLLSSFFNYKVERQNAEEHRTHIDQTRELVKAMESYRKSREAKSSQDSHCEEAT